ncbi:MAG: hypothetical protein IKR81_11130 [Victivallales bacterium]|nr:hypothetical protein [Victivallales bacterium]
MTKLEELTSWDGEQSLTIPPFETDLPCVRREAVKEFGVFLRLKEHARRWATFRECGLKSHSAREASRCRVNEARWRLFFRKTL